MAQPLSNALTAAADLSAAESAFSVLAGRVGLREVFRVTGAPGTVNTGGSANPHFVVGPDSVAAAVSEGQGPAGSQLSWASDRVIVAASGDLGVSIGFIVAPVAGGGVPNRIPVFTIWRRGAAGEPWLCVAE